jgi:hypothetical protein
MLLDGKGVRTIAGPGTLVGGVFTRTGPVIARRDRIGGTRAVADRPRPAPSRGRGETWLVDLSSSNTICLPEGRLLILSRLGAESAIELQPIEGGPSSRIEWLGYAPQADWPAGLPTAPGTRYRLTGPAAAGSRVIEFRSLDPADPVCAAQIDRNFEATGG